MKSNIKIRKPYIDNRGKITNILDLSIGSTAIIYSKKGSIRANHYHKRHWHYCYVLDGRIEYYSKKRNSSEKIKKEVFKKGDLFYTPPQIIHAMHFPINTTFITLGSKSRSKESYEKDLVRVPDFFKK